MVFIPKIFSTAIVKIAESIDNSWEIDQRDSNGKTIYQDGRKTIHSFGKNKRFAIEKGFWEGETTWCLFDREKSGIDATLDYIECYDSTPSRVYTKGSKGYTKLNYETAEVKQSQNINEFSQEDQEVFKKLDAGEGCKKIIKDK